MIGNTHGNDFMRNLEDRDKEFSESLKSANTKAQNHLDSKEYADAAKCYIFIMDSVFFLPQCKEYKDAELKLVDLIYSCILFNNNANWHANLNFKEIETILDVSRTVHATADSWVYFKIKAERIHNCFVSEIINVHQLAIDKLSLNILHFLSGMKDLDSSLQGLISDTARVVVNQSLVLISDIKKEICSLQQLDLDKSRLW